VVTGCLGAGDLGQLVDVSWSRVTALRFILLLCVCYIEQDEPPKALATGWDSPIRQAGALVTSQHTGSHTR
jgi:hypothetical protein